MKVVLLGSGFIGSSLSEHLNDRGCNLTTINRTQLDYTEPKQLEHTLKTLGCTVLINCTGYTGVPNVDACELDKENCYFYNVTLPLRMVKICEKLGIKLVNVSSGCIYTGYTKNFTETDIPNFGIYNPDSSFYSKTKHICENNLANFDAITLRIRMPFNNKAVPKNLIYKIFKYDNIIDYPNSGTNTDNLNVFIYNLITTNALTRIVGPLNVVNPGVITGKKIADLLASCGLTNPNWKLVDIKDLDIKAQRSNCVLDESKAVSQALLMPHVDDILEDTVKSFITRYKA